MYLDNKHNFEEILIFLNSKNKQIKKKAVRVVRKASVSVSQFNNEGVDVPDELLSLLVSAALEEDDSEVIADSLWAIGNLCLKSELTAEIVTTRWLNSFIENSKNCLKTSKTAGNLLFLLRVLLSSDNSFALKDILNDLIERKDNYLTKEILLSIAHLELEREKDAKIIKFYLENGEAYSYPEFNRLLEVNYDKQDLIGVIANFDVVFDFFSNKMLEESTIMQYLEVYHHLTYFRQSTRPNLIQVYTEIVTLCSTSPKDILYLALCSLINLFDLVKMDEILTNTVIFAMLRVIKRIDEDDLLDDCLKIIQNAIGVHSPTENTANALLSTLEEIARSNNRTNFNRCLSLIKALKDSSAAKDFDIYTSLKEIETFFK